jgi:hypothetical protein
MANPSPDGTNNGNNKKPAKVKGQVPPDERFWKRYSPHFEFLLSLCSSTFVHAIGLCLLFLIGVMFVHGRDKDAGLPMDTISIAGGGGNAEGTGGGPGDGIVAQNTREAVDQAPPKEPVRIAPKTEKLDAPAPDNTPILDPSKMKSTRFVDDTALSMQKLSAAGKKADDKLRGLLAGKGEGGRGKGGGKGGGAGTGEGDDTGPGKGGKLTQREKRRNRWMMIFNIRDSIDYARQLHDLGAILAIELPDGRYKVFRNLEKRPVQGTMETYDDLVKMNRIFWWDDMPNSVANLASALGLNPIPERFAAFFPKELEKQLREAESAEYSGDEDNIALTTFRVVRRGGKYEPVVQEVRRR